MSRIGAPSGFEMKERDEFYRAGGLSRMESPDIHYNNPTCPHQGCTQRLEWIDFQLELFGDLQRIYNPLVRAWWEGKGFVGQCPTCGGWIRFTTLAMEALCDTEAARYLTLPENWHAVAQLG